MHSCCNLASSYVFGSVRPFESLRAATLLNNSLAVLSQASHDLVPPDVLRPCIRTLANQFVTDRSSPEVRLLLTFVLPCADVPELVAVLVAGLRFVAGFLFVLTRLFRSLPTCSVLTTGDASWVERDSRSLRALPARHGTRPSPRPRSGQLLRAVSMASSSLDHTDFAATCIFVVALLKCCFSFAPLFVRSHSTSARSRRV